MISLADYAEKHCQSSDIRNEIYKIMLQICAESDDEHIKSKADYYYKKLPSLRQSREIYAKCVMTDDEYRSQLKKNLIQLVDMAECTVRQLISPDMPLDVRLEYYKKAAALYEIVLDNKYAAFSTRRCSPITVKSPRFIYVSDSAARRTSISNALSPR